MCLLYPEELAGRVCILQSAFCRGGDLRDGYSNLGWPATAFEGPIAEKYGASTSTVNNRLREFGLTGGNKRSRKG
jgi:hypothetical protein